MIHPATTLRLNPPHSRSQARHPQFGDKPIGRPPRIDDAEVRRLRKSGWPVKDIAERYGVGIKAVYASLYRSKGKD